MEDRKKGLQREDLNPLGAFILGRSGKSLSLLFPKISEGLRRLDLQNKWTDAIKGVAIAG
jgi:hypothetical protein